MRSSIIDRQFSRSIIISVVGEALGPFPCCTSNQFIAHYLLTKDSELCESILREAAVYVARAVDDADKRVAAGVKVVVRTLLSCKYSTQPARNHDLSRRCSSLLSEWSHIFRPMLESVSSHP